MRFEVREVRHCLGRPERDCMQCGSQRRWASCQMMPFHSSHDVFVLKRSCSGMQLITPGISECLTVTLGIYVDDLSRHLLAVSQSIPERHVSVGSSSKY